LACLCSLLFSFLPDMAILPSVGLYSIAVELSIFLMIALIFEHQQAGTALDIAQNSFSVNAVAAVVLSALILAVAHSLVCRHCCDLACSLLYPGECHC
jgi:hypothetical protein